MENRSVILLGVLVLIVGTDGSRAGLDKQCPEGCRDMDKMASCIEMDLVDSCVVHLNGTVVMQCVEPCMRYTLGSFGCRTEASCSGAEREWVHLYVFFDNLEKWYTQLSSTAQTVVSVVMGLYGCYYIALSSYRVTPVLASAGPLVGFPVALAACLTAGVYDYSTGPDVRAIFIAICTSLCCCILLSLRERASAAVVAGTMFAFVAAATIAKASSPSRNTFGAREVFLIIVPLIAFSVGVGISLKLPHETYLFSTVGFGSALVTQFAIHFAWSANLLSCGALEQCVADVLFFATFLVGGILSQYYILPRYLRIDPKLTDGLWVTKGFTTVNVTAVAEDTALLRGTDDGLWKAPFAGNPGNGYGGVAQTGAINGGAAHVHDVDDDSSSSASGENNQFHETMLATGPNSPLPSRGPSGSRNESQEVVQYALAE